MASVESTLRDVVKPLFQSNPHPSLNLSTGRTLPRPAGGTMAFQDYYQSQRWKENPGAADLVSWCVRNTDTNEYETRWHLIIPPVMTLLDDYEAKYKLQGVKIVSEMLGRVPPELLRRTGIDGLLLTSLTTCLHHLHNPETPDLLRAAIKALVSLIERTSTLSSAHRFDALCGVLGQGIIGSVWLYASEDADTVLATVDVLPDVLRAMGLGCARYLKALILQLVHPLEPTIHPPHVQLQLSSVHALCVVVDICAVRMHKWKGIIITAVGKCWATLVSTKNNDEVHVELRRALRGLISGLATACPSVVQDEYQRLVAAETELFQSLIPPDHPNRE